MTNKTISRLEHCVEGTEMLYKFLVELSKELLREGPINPDEASRATLKASMACMVITAGLQTSIEELTEDKRAQN